MVIHIMVKNNKIANAFLFQSLDLKDVSKSKRLQDVYRNLNYRKRYNAFAKKKVTVYSALRKNAFARSFAEITILIKQ
jgi:hypothetical protein